ncbi:hypothetical protein ACP70R_046200 [Stipagrostis hirtigluma subsp. patula]
MAAVECLWWWPLAPWLSPAAAWFIFFNAVVGAIAVMSWGQQGHLPSRRRLCRSASSMVFDRLRSFSIFPVHPAGGYGGATGTPADVDGDVPDYYCYPREAEDAPSTKVCTELDEPAKASPRAVTASEAPACTAPPAAPAATAACTAPVATSPAEDDAASASVSDGEEDEADAKEEKDDKSISLDEAYALALQARQPRTQSSTATAAAAEAATAVATPKKRKPAKLAAGTRGRGHGCGRREAEEALEGKAELNARAELFIRQFRADLRLQRLNSILNYAQALSPRAAAEAPAAR